MAAATSSESTSGRSDVAAQFMVLVDEWIIAHPVQNNMLSLDQVRFAAAKILLWKSKKEASRRSWPGECASQLVGILLCLLAFEGLLDHQAPLSHQMDGGAGSAAGSRLALGGESLGTKDEPNVLGLSCAEILDLTREAVRRKQLTREDVVKAILEMDIHGSMTQLATSVELAEALFDNDGVAAMRGTEAVAESAPFDDLSAAGLGNVRPVLERAVRLRLAHRFMAVRLLLVVIVASWFLYAELISARLSRLEQAPFPWYQIVPFAICLGLGSIIVAASFPTDLNSLEGRRFIMPATVPCSICAFIASCMSFFGKHAHLSQVNVACRRVHAAICCSIVIGWTACAYLGVRGNLTWRALRGVLLVDSTTFLAGNVLLYCFGPPLAYQPRNVTPMAAACRASIPAALALLLSPANRLRISALFNNFGWNHVVLSLRTLRRVRFRGERASGSYDSSSASQSSHSSGARRHSKVRRRARRTKKNEDTVAEFDEGSAPAAPAAPPPPPPPPAVLCF